MSLTTCRVAPPHRRSNTLDTVIVSPADGVELLTVRDTRQLSLVSRSGPAGAAFATPADPVTRNAPAITSVPNSAIGFRSLFFICAPSPGRHWNAWPRRPRRAERRGKSFAPPFWCFWAPTRASERRDSAKGPDVLRGQLPKLLSEPRLPLALPASPEPVSEPRLPVSGSVGSVGSGSGSGSTIAGAMNARSESSEDR